MNDITLTLRETMWFHDGPVLTRDNPIQYEVVGLPPGHERILIGQNLDVRPIRWQILRFDGVFAWRGGYETPEAALAELQSEFNER